MSKKPETTDTQKDNDTSSSDNSCQRPLTSQEEALRQGRKSLVSTLRSDGKNKIRYIEGTTPLKDGCWLSD